jgi:tol-pal system protein YbgF
MRTKSIAFATAAVLIGAIGGSMLAPRPTGAVSKEIIQLQEQVSQLMQGQQAIRSAIDANNASMRTLVQQSLDAVNALNGQMTTLQNNVQEATANSGSKIDTMSTQAQGLSDNLSDVQARVGKLASQLNDIQSTLQSIDGRLAGAVPGAAPAAAPAPGTVPTQSTAPVPGPSGYANPGSVPASPAPGGGNGFSSMPAISSDTLYQNALRDFTTGKYDLARQEFGDYVKQFPSTDLASNAQFYLGEISYQQGDYKDAIVQYNLVLTDYPQSYKQGASLLKKGFAEIELGTKTTGIRDLREVVRRFPGTDDSRRAQAKLKELGVASSAHSAPH